MAAGGRDRRRLMCCLLHLLETEALAMGAVAANLGALDHNLETEDSLDLSLEILEGFAEKFFDAAATKTDDVCVLALHLCLVIVLVTVDVHQVELIDETAGFQHLQRTVYRNPVQAGVDLPSHKIEALGIQVLT